MPLENGAESCEWLVRCVCIFIKVEAVAESQSEGKAHIYSSCTFSLGKRSLTKKRLSSMASEDLR